MIRTVPDQAALGLGTTTPMPADRVVAAVNHLQDERDKEVTRVHLWCFFLTHLEIFHVFAAVVVVFVVEEDVALLLLLPLLLLPLPLLMLLLAT